MTRLVLIITLFPSLWAQEPPTYLSARQVKEDLSYLSRLLEETSSYQGLNGFQYQEALGNYLAQLGSDSVHITDFGYFLKKTIGLIGDRHAYASGFDRPRNGYLPFVVAPLDDKVIALRLLREKKQYEVLYPKYPYLRQFNDIPIEEFIERMGFVHQKAPPIAFWSRAVKDLKYMSENYTAMGLEMPQKCRFIFSDAQGKSDTLVELPVETKRRAHYTWSDKVYHLHSRYKEEDFNEPPIIEQLFEIKAGNIAYFRIPDMVSPQDAPNLYSALRDFMEKIKNTRALVIDIRQNGGGVRPLIWELAGYVVHPDSIYVANTAQQRASEFPLNAAFKKDMHNRYLYAYSELDSREQAAVDQFLQTFQPVYQLSPDKFSQMHYALFNGQKISQGKYHYTKPVYVLADERSFSAASVLAASFKGLPGVSLVGETTDASSGNSERYRLPHSQIRGKISTMVSFQKDGKGFDSFGTEPDIHIPRDLNQVLFKRDSQLEILLDLIRIR